jgi:glycosyltransferase involved in cell wall biosynthesis
MPHGQIADTGRRRLIVLQVLPALESGGTERGVIEVAEALVAAGHRSIVISAGGRKVVELTKLGSEHVKIDLGTKSPLTLRHIPWLRRFLLEQNVDVVDIHSRMPGWITFAAWRSLPVCRRPALVSTVHGFYSVNSYSSIMCRGQHVVAVSDSVADYIRQNYSFVPDERLHVIHRGIDQAEFPRGFRPTMAWESEFFHQFPAAANKKILAIVGRISRLKGHLDFIRLVGELRVHDHDIHGLIVGDVDPRKSAYREEIRQMIATMGLHDHVTFTGHRSDVREIYSISRVVLCLSSTPESFGRTVAEAISIGTPVVAYSHGGVAEILAAEFPEGAVECQNFGALTARVRHVLDRADLCIPGINRFEKSAMLERTLQLYEAASEHRNGSRRS